MMATAKGCRTQRYRPACEYDNATLAKKREYWRTKKREQRAKVAAVKKKLGVENAVVCDARRNVLGAHVQNAASRPTLLNSDGSYQTNPCDSSESSVFTPCRSEQGAKTGGSEALTSGACVPGSSRNLQNASTGQKARWFHNIKLNRVLPKFPDRPGASQGSAESCRKMVRMSTTGPSFASNSPAKSNGSLLNTHAPVPAVRVTVHPATTVNHRPPNRRVATNKSFLCNQSLSPKGSSGLNDHKRPQVGAQSPHKAVPPSVTTKVGISVKRCPPEVRSVNTKTTPRALGTKIARPLGQTPETEEERAAKRREVWRLKKREQRANKAAKLAKERERMSRTNVPPKQVARPTCVDLNTPSQWKQGHTRQAVHQPRLPAPPMQRQNHTLTLPGPGSGPGLRPISKSTNTALTKTPPLSNCITIDPGPPSVVVKTGGLKQSRAYFTPSTATATCAVSNNMNLGPGVSYASRVVTGAQFSHAARSIVRPKMQTNKFVRTQRFLAQRNTWMSFSSFRENPEETAEEKMARKREYWRIKKREQRARLSTEVKAKLRERDSLLRRVKRYQSILEEMRRARAANQKGQHPPRGNSVTNTNTSTGAPLEPIGGFIKEDGTVTISIPTPSSVPPSAVGTKAGAEKVFTSNPLPSPIPRGHVSTSRGGGGFSCHVNVNPPPLQRRAVQMKNTHPGRVSVQTPPKLVCIRPRGVSNNHQNKFTGQMPGMTKIAVSASNSGQSMIHATTNLRRVGSVARPVGRAPVAVQPNPNQALTEEQRIAQRREYWRIKKREQRAKRAARLRQGLLRGRALAAKRRRQNQIPEPSPSTGSQTTTTTTTTTTTITPPAVTVNNSSCTLPTPPSMPTPLPEEKVKQEQDLSLQEDVSAPLEQPVCSDIKPSLTLPAETQSEVEPSGGTDTQATTLLAVASMKKLLEESLCTVESADTPETTANIKVEAPLCKTEEDLLPVEPSVMPDIKQDPTLEPVKESVEADMPASICFSAEITHLQTNENSGCNSPPPLSHFPPLNPQCSQEIPPPTYAPSCPDPLTSSAAATPTSFCSPQQSPTCTQTLTALASPQTMQGQCHTGTTLRPSCAMKTLNQQAPGLQKQHEAQASDDGSILQRKREYWRFMKRQQRARKAQEKRGIPSRKLGTKTHQAPNFVSVAQRPLESSYRNPSLPLNKPLPTACALQSRTHLAPVNPSPSLHVVRPPAPDVHRQQNLRQYGLPPSDRSLATQRSPQARCAPRADISSLPSCRHAPPPPPVGSREVPPPPMQQRAAPPVPSGETTGGPLLLVESSQRDPLAPGHVPGVRRWSLQVQSVKSAHPPASLAHPSATTHHHSSEPVSPMGPPLTTTNNNRWPAKHVDALGPHKRTQGAVEDDDEVMRRKREYWRVKKKEQRARKAAREKGLGQVTTMAPPPPWEPVLPTTQNQLPHNVQSQGSKQWFKEETDVASSSSMDTDLGYLGMPSHAEPMTDKAELAFQKYHDDDADCAGPISVDAWRSRYLMDYDPVNQLLVCMVCGEQQYSYSPEGARAHIEEAHPETLSLGQQQRQRLQDAWDQQVAQREQFFTSQLQQHAMPHTETVAEVEVTVDMDDSSESMYSKSAKTKNMRKF
ncbi:hypothetical protein ACEWY4_025067 [Coilia grayii]|uniref:SPIN-DOC-like zinc-finger domain-containing protein n=1 Tax=Coilia grayii TaxID=363190 RepID=A0ABD1J0B6_9TELE